MGVTLLERTPTFFNQYALQRGGVYRADAGQSDCYAAVVARLARKYVRNTEFSDRYSWLMGFRMNIAK